MKNHLLIVSWSALILLIISLSAVAHPVKTTSSLIEYNSETTNINIECRVFIDDFEKVVNGLTSLGEMVLSEEDVKKIEDYFNNYYKIVLNNQKLHLSYTAYKVFVASNVLSLKFIIGHTPITKGDKVQIENKLFFEEFGPLQSNSMTLRFTPFIPQQYHQTTLTNYLVKYQF